MLDADLLTAAEQFGAADAHIRLARRACGFGLPANSAGAGLASLQLRLCSLDIGTRPPPGRPARPSCPVGRFISQLSFIRN
jgi:hypothetical protein